MHALRKEGGKTADSPDQISAQVDVIIMSLPNSNVVNEVVKSSLKLFEIGRKGLILIDTTTADPIMSEELAVRLRERGIEMLDATASGTSKMCAAKDIIFMVGGKEEIFRESLPFFLPWLRKQFFWGKMEQGH